MPRPAGNCLNWIVGHLVRGYEQTLPHLGQEPVLGPGALERYARGSLPVEDAEEVRPFDELSSVWTQCEPLQAARPSCRLVSNST